MNERGKYASDKFCISIYLISLKHLVFPFLHDSLSYLFLFFIHSETFPT